MPLPPTVDFDALLGPVSEAKPAGESIRYDGVYDAIQEARREEDALPMGDWEREVKSADWSSVIELATEAIGKKSKDLQIGVWLAEALVKKHGFAGVRDGLRLLRGLQENFWDGLFPEVEDGDLEFRASPLHWLNEKLPACIKTLVITDGPGRYCWFQWEESRKVDNLGRQDPAAMEAAVAEGKITGERFDSEVQATPRAFYEELLLSIDQSREELSALEKIVDERFARDAPSLLGVRQALDDCHALVADVLKKKRAQDPTYKPAAVPAASEAPPTGAAVQGQQEAARGGAAVGWFGEPRSRDEAFQQLAVISAYLKRSEPQHPVTYLLERAIRWTKMPLEEWLGEVVRNDDVLQQLRDTLGIKSQNP
jgi:type VI secretion system protein ImpA